VEKTLLVLLFAVTLVSGLVIGGGAVYIFHSVPNMQTAAPAPAISVTSPAPPVSQLQPAEPAPSRAASDAERARAHVERGDFLPLETITAALHEKFPGDILGVKLGEDDGITYYEFKIMTSGGRVIEVEVDPKTGRVVDVDDDD